MSDLEQKRPFLIETVDATDAGFCVPDAHGHCITCSDEALPATVLEIDALGFTAVVDIAGASTEIDISLVEDVAIGQTLLVHGGVALGTVGAISQSR